MCGSGIRLRRHRRRDLVGRGCGSAFGHAVWEKRIDMDKNQLHS